MTFDSFLESAWTEHGERPQAVADRLGASIDLLQTPEHVVQLARLAAHVYGEHLGQWQRGIEFLDRLRTMPAAADGAGVHVPLARAIAALRCARGDANVLDGLADEDRAHVLAGAATALAGRTDFPAALQAYEAALRLAEGGLPAASPAIRALAIGGNNLAAALEEKADRTPFETEGMIAAARAGLRYWKQAGTWLEEERAEYRLARTLLQAGRADDASRAAQRCVDVCALNAAPPLEQFFAHAVLAFARRAAGDRAGHDASRGRALAALADMPSEEARLCEAERRELDA